MNFFARAKHAFSAIQNLSLPVWIIETVWGMGFIVGKFYMLIGGAIVLGAITHFPDHAGYQLGFGALGFGIMWIGHHFQRAVDQSFPAKPAQ